MVWHFFHCCKGKLMRTTLVYDYYECSGCHRRWLFKKCDGWTLIDKQWLSGGEWTVIDWDKVKLPTNGSAVRRG